ncbi:GBF-interacting protein like [Actinidia chinensis var. chinensis]|uniref:GBF-interacting protein like n=1 Tax=Actinidia chinensis var. chinensis TaxID=1590841 RepID=A0A2R6QWD2_ACTCC|nr:GBF-interacting protein like [Actinidia chinensis var. chinensis]
MSSGSRVSIPSSVRNTIQNIKEIAGNHSEEEIYAMLKDCSMDPNETAQKLLLQDTFHEVKRKRDRRKENLSNKESAESRWRPGMQGRGSRGGRGNFSIRYVSNDVSGGKKSASDKESGINQVSEKGVELSSIPASQESKNKEVTPFTSSQTVITNGHIVVAPGSSGVVHAAHLTVGSLVNQSEEGSAVDSIKLGGPPPLPHSVNAVEKPSIDFGTGDTHGQQTSSSSNISTAGNQAPSPGVYFSASDPVLVPSHDSRLPGAVVAIKREVGSQRTPAEQISLAPSEGKSIAAISEVGSSSAQGTIASKSLVVVSSIHGGSSTIRPSLNYRNRSQQVIQKAGPSKEWKPKPPNPIPAQGSGTTGSTEVPTIAEANAQLQHISSALDSNEANSKLHRKLEELHVSDGQHVIIPNHLHVPEAEKIGFCFGSFDTNFGFSMGHNNIPENDRNPTPLSETSESVEEAAEQSSSNLNALERTGEGDYPDYPQSPRHVPENLLAGEGDVSSTTFPEYTESKKETSLPLEGDQYSMVHTSPSYSFGFMPPMVNSQIAPFESSDAQARDVSRLPSFVVPPPFDPVSYYAQFYRPGTDSDGRISPFQSPGVATKYNGNVSVLTPQTSQSVQEGGNSVLSSSAGPTLLTQAAGVMQSSIPVAQQPLPFFRHPNGMPISHYPPNYIPYGHYFSPVYVPPQAIHQFLSNGGFPHQPQAGGVYPTPPGPTAKYSLPQYKVATNTANSAHVGVASSYGPYGSTPAGYNPISASTAGNSTLNEDLNTPQFKENNVYIAGQQSEGSSVWFNAPGRDISGLQASSFYNIPPQSQVTFTPTQSGHGTFAGIYHPAQAVSATIVHPLLQQSQPMAAPVDIMGPTTSVYQQPQHTQINWPNNY